MIALGLLLLVVAAVVALVGIFTNLGSSHQLGRTVDLLGYHLHGSTGKLLLVGVIIGAIGMLGLNMLMAGIGRGFKRTVSQRKERRSEQQHTDTVLDDRDQLAAKLEQEHAARVHAEQQNNSQHNDAPPTVRGPRRLITRERNEQIVPENQPSDSSGSEQPGATPRRDL